MNAKEYKTLTHLEFKILFEDGGEAVSLQHGRLVNQFGVVGGEIGEVVDDRHVITGLRSAQTISVLTT